MDKFITRKRRYEEKCSGENEVTNKGKNVSKKDIMEKVNCQGKQMWEKLQWLT
jgi:hypothetical protein